VREAGAKKIYFASACPPIRFPNVYGIDMATTTELIAHNRTEDEISELIGADWLIYQDLEDLIESAKHGNPSIQQFECSVFDGKYITADIDRSYLKKLEETRSDDKKSRKLN
jgi:amidophosphoribosyltransferase